MGHFIAAKAGKRVALDYVNRLQKHCESYAIFPKRGSRRDDIQPGLRIAHYRKRVTLAFSVETNEVVFHGLFYGGQNVDDILSIKRGKKDRR